MSDTFDAMQKRVQEVFGAFDETALIILKGHLLVEETLDEIIQRFVFHAEFVEAANLRFAQKLQIARSMSLDEHENTMWEIGARLNTLRNELAHSLESDRRAKKTKALVDAYVQEAKNDPHFAEVQKQDEHVILANAVVYFIGFLGSFKNEVERFRTVVDSMDAILNSHRHAKGGK